MRQQQAHLAQRLEQLVFWRKASGVTIEYEYGGEMTECCINCVVRYWQLFEIFISWIAQLILITCLNYTYSCAFLALLTILNAHLFEIFASSFCWWLCVNNTSLHLQSLKNSHYFYFTEMFDIFSWVNDKNDKTRDFFRWSHDLSKLPMNISTCVFTHIITLLVTTSKYILKLSLSII